MLGRRFASSSNILVAWYGSFEGAGTIGDLLALKSVVAHLVDLGHRVLHASAFSAKIDGATRVDLQCVSAYEIDLLVFVCGPILAQLPQTRVLFEKFAHVRKVGVSVSILPNGHFNHWNPFDAILAREGAGPNFEDVAILAPAEDHGLIATPDRKKHVGIVLRGPQSEYGTDLCEAERTRTLVAAGVRHAEEVFGVPSIEIENHLYLADCTPAEIEAKYRRCRLIITSRFHGAVMAIRSNVPFVAIDQIRGGAKVSILLDHWGWPHVYAIDSLNEATLKAAINVGLSGILDDRVRDVASAVRGRARNTLDALSKLIAS